tara:strand:- start:288 stop:524 length:237 start_codon:yes stop_codon:yes gene_type:complete
MSADNAILYRQIGNAWYLLEGSASAMPYSDEAFQRKGQSYETLSKCLEKAHEMAEGMMLLEYGIMHHPTPETDMVNES